MNASIIGAEVASQLSRADNISPVTDKEEAFFRKMRGTPYVSNIDFDHLRRLKDAFKNATAEDPYSLSPTYYGLTGRRGLWVHHCESGDTAMIFCLHPNKDDTVLVFPPFGISPKPMLTGFLEHIAPLGMKMQIGRVYEEDTNLLEFACAARGLTASVVPETTLDWAYPVHTIATAALKARQGGAYAKVRGAYNKFSRIREERGAPLATVAAIDFRQDRKLLEKVAHEWEANSNANYYEKYDKSIPTDYFLTLIQIAQRPDIGLQGLKIFLNGEVKGFSIWERPYNASKAANLYASQVADFSQTNLGTFLTVKSAEYILSQGGPYMCLGGSETAKMDKFKRSFVPHKSKNLVTIEIAPK